MPGDAATIDGYIDTFPADVQTTPQERLSESP